MPQACISGAVTGFFVHASSSSDSQIPSRDKLRYDVLPFAQRRTKTPTNRSILEPVRTVVTQSACAAATGLKMQVGKPLK